jgi:hypothetical protein
MKLNNRFLFALLFVAVSCGVRNDDEAYKNLLIGNWIFSGMDCYKPDISGVKKEIYSVNSLHTNEILFTSRTFVYSVSEGGGACNTTANGNFLVEYLNSTEGTISYSSITTNSAQCAIEHVENTGAVKGSIEFGFSTTVSNSTNIKWSVIADELTLQVSTGYKGTSQAAYCASQCTCFSRYTRDTSN